MPRRPVEIELQKESRPSKNSARQVADNNLPRLLYIRAARGSALTQKGTPSPIRFAAGPNSKGTAKQKALSIDLAKIEAVRAGIP